MNGMVSTVLEKLRSDSVDENECACNTLAGLLDEPGASDLFVASGIVRHLIPHLSSKSPELLHAALGAMRNLSVEGGVDACKRMADEGVITPLFMSLQRMLLVSESVTDSERYVVRGAVVEGLNLLCNLCESCEGAISVVKPSEFVGILVGVVASASYADGSEDGMSVRLAAGHCLYIMSDSNPSMCKELRVDVNLSALVRVIDMPVDRMRTVQDLLLYSYITGILTSIIGDTSIIASDLPNSTAYFQLVPIIATIMSLVMKYSELEHLTFITVEINELSRVLKNESVAPGQNGAGDNDTSHGIQVVPSVNLLGLQKLIDNFQYLCQSKKVIIELIANIISARDSSDGSDDGWEDCSTTSDGSTDEQNMETMTSPTATATCMDTDMIPVNSDQKHSLLSNLYSLVIAPDIIAGIFGVACPSVTYESCLSSVRSSHLASHHLVRDLFAQHGARQTAQIAALLCVSNIIESVPLEVVGGVDVVNVVWDKLIITLGSLQQAIDDVDFLDAVVSALRAAACKLVTINPVKLSMVGEAGLADLHGLIVRCTVPEVRAKVVRIIAYIGSSLVAQQPVTAHLLKDMLSFLYSVSCNDTDMSVSCESLDSLFDVFSDDTTDSILSDFSLVSKLRALKPTFKKRLLELKRGGGSMGGAEGGGARGKQRPHNTAIISSTCDVLNQFISYKSKRGIL